jgi:YidC/Oxa1 family membrane protein insertase
MDFLVDGLLALTRLFGGSLGLALIFIGIVSRVVFYPMLKSSYKHIDIQRRLKPKLDALKKKYSNNPDKLRKEQAQLMLESGFNPLAGCLPLIVQIVVAIILWNALNGFLSHADSAQLASEGIDLQFLWWDLSKPDVFYIAGLAFALPGALSFGYAIATFLQSKMMLPAPLEVAKNDKQNEVKEKEGLAESFAASQGQLVFLMPLIILFVARLFPSGLTLYFFVNTAAGVVLQYYISGWGGLEPWLRRLKK